MVRIPGAYAPPPAAPPSPGTPDSGPARVDQHFRAGPLNGTQPHRRY
jgi:hypothetical protein